MLARLGAGAAPAHGCGARRVPGHARNDLRRPTARTLGPGPPRPGDCVEVMELFPAPALDKGASRY
eukprot:423025-Alexandrium_andersonii.AAC.1